MNLKRVLIFSFVFIQLVVWNKVHAQFPNPADFNTATNATNTGTLPVGANDLHWTASMTGINGTYVPAVSVGPLAPASWAVSPYVNANWISYPHTCTPNAWNDHWCNGAVDVYYKLIVNLPTSNCAGSSVSTPSAYCLTLDYFSDNWVNAVYVNGILSYTNYIANPGGSWGFLQANGKTVNLCNNWTAGSNTVIVFTTSGSGWGGFLAQANQTVSSNYSNVLTSTVSVTNASCFNGLGSATVTAGGVSGPYTYTWLPSGGNSNVASLAAGNYTVIVGSGACTVSKTLTITQPAGFSINVSPSATICPGTSTVFTASGANTYTWNTGATGANLTASISSIYTVTGSDASGCTNTATVGLMTHPAPVISISGNTLICGAGATTTLTANGANTYTWMPGNMNGMTAVVSPPSSTIYTVTGAFVSTGCSNTATIGVIANGFVLTPGPLLNICLGQSATLTANGMTDYTWTPGNFNGPSYVVTPTASQDYTVLGAIGSCTYTANQFVTVTPLPTVNINPNPPPMVCPGTPVTLNATGATTYIWQPGNLNGATISVAPMSNQVYTVTGNTGGCIDEATVLLTLAPSVNVNVSAPLTICKGDIATLTATGANYYNWEPGGGAGSSFTVQPMHNTTYTVTASNGGTCIATTTVNVNVNYVNADFVFDPVKPTYDDYIHFTNISTHNTNNFWYFTNQTISNEVSPTILFDEPGTYVACLLVSDVRGCDDTLCKEIIVGCPENAVYIPNTFTPNDDGLNDIFRVGTLGQCIESFEMDIFDRWGERIFNTKTLEKGWDGKVRGTLAKDDVYVYLVKYTMTNKKAYTKTGHVMLMK